MPIYIFLFDWLVDWVFIPVHAADADANAAVDACTDGADPAESDVDIDADKIVSYLFENQRLSRNRKCNNQLYDFLGTFLELGEDYIC